MERPEREPEANARTVTWERIEKTPEFAALLAAKRRFVVPATVFFVVYYFALPVLVGYAPALMATPLGSVNVAYVFALSQFLMAWVLAALYVRAATRFDRMAKELAAKGGPTGALGEEGR
jgi:uncharacterized membrane protein (DUF485 family)